MNRKTLKIIGLSLLAGVIVGMGPLLVLWSIDSWKVWQQLSRKELMIGADPAPLIPHFAQWLSENWTLNCFSRELSIGGL